MPTREDAMTALLSAIQAQGFFVTTGRRARDPGAIGPAQSPACFVVVESETIINPPIGSAKRSLKVTAFVYNDVGNNLNAIPETALNNGVDALEAALAVDNFADGRCTLGGVVFAALVRGEVHRAPAELTGKALALVPIELILP